MRKMNTIFNPLTKQLKIQRQEKKIQRKIEKN